MIWGVPFPVLWAEKAQQSVILLRWNPFREMKWHQDTSSITYPFLLVPLLQTDIDVSNPSFLDSRSFSSGNHGCFPHLFVCLPEKKHLSKMLMTGNVIYYINPHQLMSHQLMPIGPSVTSKCWCHMMSWNYSPTSGSLPASDCRSFLISSPWFFATAWDRLDGRIGGWIIGHEFISMHPEKTWFNPQNSSIVVIWLYRFT